MQNQKHAHHNAGETQNPPGVVCGCVVAFAPVLDGLVSRPTEASELGVVEVAHLARRDVLDALQDQEHDLHGRGGKRGGDRHSLIYERGKADQDPTGDVSF